MMQNTVLKHFLIFFVLCAGGCQHAGNSHKPDTLPSWIQRPKAVQWDPKANAMAHLACRNSKSVLSAHEKITLQVFEAHHPILLFEPSSNASKDWNSILEQEAMALKATHVGAFDGPIKNKRCIALVLLRRHVNNKTYLPKMMNTQSVTPFRLTVERPIQRPELFIQHPSGKVDKRKLTVKNDQTLAFTIEGHHWPKGHYIVEVLGQTEQGNPEILFWWRLTQKERMPHPWPRLRYEELSQTDQARSMKIENMIVQLRGTAQVHRLHVSPQLKKVAQIRAQALSDLHGIGHNRPHAQTPDEALKHNFPQPEVVKLAEIQAQSATLKEAWDGIVESPAHVLPLISKGVSHMGAAAILGDDAAGNPSVTLVILLGSDEKLQLSEQQLRLHLLTSWNMAREQNQQTRFVRHEQLEAEAQKVAAAMAQEGPLKSWSIENGLITDLLNQFEDLNQITGSLMYSNDPKALDKTPWLQNKAFSQVGIGLVSAPDSNLWFICILVGEPAE